MKDRIPLDPEARADTVSQADNGTPEFAPELAYKRLAMVSDIFFGRPMHGEPMRTALQTLARNFDQVAVPKYGREGRNRFAPEMLRK